MAEAGLRTFGDAHLKVDGVSVDIHLHWVYIGEHITIVPVIVAHRIVVFAQTLVHLLLVIDIATLHAQQFLEIFGVDHRIADPGDVAHKIALSLIHLQQDVDMLLIVVPNRVFENCHIPVSQLIIFIHEILFGSLVPFVGKLLRLQETAQFACLVHLGEHTFPEQSTLDFPGRKILVALDDNMADFHLGLLVHVHIQDYLVVTRHIVTLGNIDFRIFVTLLIKIFLCENLGTVNHIGRNLTSLHDAQLGLHILALAFLEPGIVDGTHSGPLGKMDAEVHLGAHDRVGGDGHLREESMAPIPSDSICDFTSRDRDLLSFSESRESDEHIIFVALDSSDTNATDFTVAGGSGV